jgi:gliding motility-associated-like protein
VNSFVTSTLDTAVCSNQLPFHWNGQDFNSDGNYSVTLNASNGCDSIAKLNLTVNQQPPMPSVTSPVNYCQLETAQPLSATGTNNLLWYSSPSGGTASATIPLPSTTNAAITNYYVSQSAGGCESQRATITVNVFESPALGADKTVNLCNAASVDLVTLYNTVGSTANWSLNNIPVADPATVSTAGIYQLIATKPSGCADTALVTVTVQPPVIAFAGNDDSTEIYVPYQLSGTGGSQYEWLPGAPLLNNATIPNPVATLTATTTFSLIVKDVLGCKGYDTVTIKVIKGSDIYVPSAFTPNGDGKNDMLKPLGNAINQLDFFRVYNRYGELIFETHNLSKGWDGTYKGKKQNTNNYMWVLKAVDRKKVVRTMTGNVLLIR